MKIGEHSMTDSTSEHLALDEKALNKFSRQIAALGAETTARLTKMKVLIYGLRGVGAETAKNLALQGVGGITLVDEEPITVQDLGVNFFFRREDVGKKRSAVMLPRLKELNPLCSLRVSSALTEASVENHSAVVITQPLPLPTLISLNAHCRATRKSFLLALTGGVSVSLFVDHGPHHVVHDSDGEKPIQKLITDIVKISDGEVLVRYDTPEGQMAIALNGGAFEVTEVQGLDSLNGRVCTVRRDYKDPVKTVRLPYALGDGEKYQGGGLLTEKKLPSPHPMHSLEEKLRVPGSPFAEPPSLVSTDLLRWGAEVQQHIALYAVLLFFTEHQRMPRVHDAQERAQVLSYAHSLLKEKKVETDEGFELDEALFNKFAGFAAVELQPMSAFTGGVLAQEVVKATGKFTPIPGFMHFSALETLPALEDDKLFCAEGKESRESERDELAAVFGWELLDKIANYHYLMVGCGALGCEFMKNFALCGVCCGPQGLLTVTDADRIELSNLTRQFLFREHNIGQPKSRAAAAMAKLMNPSFNVQALELYVGPKSEDVFNDALWLSLDGVCNALDNIEARLYVDRQCVKYEKPLLESGTMGTNGNVDTVCPFKTRTYGEGGNAAESSGVPMCTLRNFPHLTEHCIEWSRDQFELLFSKLGKSLQSYCENREKFEAQVLDKAGSEPGAAFFDLRSLLSFCRLVRNPSIGSAAQTAYDLFHFLFRDRILDLQSAFPKDFRVIDAKTKEDKGPFWGEKKRYPTVVEFNAEDSAHVEFLQATTCLLAVCVELVPQKQEGDDLWLKEFRCTNWMKSIAAGLKVPVYMAAPVNSEGIDNAPAMDKDALARTLRALFDELHTLAAPLCVTPRESHTHSPHSPFTPTETAQTASIRAYESVDFEKDDDLNFHIQFVTAAANLRCDNYSIKRTHFHECKLIAGRIIPAIATTTAAVCGLVLLELFKLAQDKDTDAYMNRALGLGGHTYTSFTAEVPRKFVTSVEEVAPSVDEALSEDAFDEQGRVKKELYVRKVHRAYPEGHSVWDKLSVSGDLTLSQFAQWLRETHGLRLEKWDFVFGHRTMAEEGGNKNKVSVGKSMSIFPPKAVLDYSLLPSLDLSLQQATMAIMRNAAAKPTQQYIQLWKECKAAGALPSAASSSQSGEDVITADTTLREILRAMERRAEAALEKREIETATISHLEQRQFVLIESADAPLCVHEESGESVEHLCSIKIVLK